MSSTTVKRRTAAGGTAEVPIFLQKAYHMIDTCEPQICSWSEDGLTFIVKNTSLFETTIIPQFFKHNKFSSFVRQLNFYGFRKVKFTNSLKIDHKLEAETAKFWRFRHNKFRRGRKDLLTEIKRTPSTSPATASAVAIGATIPRTVAPLVSPDARKEPDKPPEEVARLKTEMEAMQRRMASMTRNIDELADLVKRVSVDDEGQEVGPIPSPSEWRAPELAEPEARFGNKRKQTVGPTNIEGMQIERIPKENAFSGSYPITDKWSPSSLDFPGVDLNSLLPGDLPLPDSASSGGMILAPSSKAPSPAPGDFVDDLFQAFALQDEDATAQGIKASPTSADVTKSGTGENATKTDKKTNKHKPCPRLMERIEDSLSTIPRDMHEMVANRLIDAIADVMEEPTDGVVDPARPVVPLPLAVAALKTIISEHGVSVECRRGPCMDVVIDGATTPFSEFLPVVPMHA